MNLNYTGEQLMLMDSVDRLLREKYPFDKFKRLVDSRKPFDSETWKAFANLGWLSLAISESRGGLGGTAIDVAVVTEMMGRHLVVEPYIPAAVLAGMLIDRLGTDPQCESLLTPLLDGSGWTALAHEERETQGDLERMTTTATKVAGGYRISGRKTAVLGGVDALSYLVTANTDRNAADKSRLGVFIVPAHAPGVDIKPYRLADGSQAVSIELSNVFLAGADLLGGNDNAFEEVEFVLDAAVSALCWDAVGAMDALLAATVEFLKQRVQFNKPLSSFQALRHRVAEMAVKCNEARASALLASLSLDGPRQLRVRGVSGAKSKIGNASRHVAHEAIQLHGAMGFTDELAVGWWFKRLFVFENVLGSTRYHLGRYSEIIRQPSLQADSLLRMPSELCFQD